MRSITMRRITGWIIGGLVAMALWVPSAGAQSFRQRPENLKHNWRDIHQDRETLRYDRSQFWQDHRAGNQHALPADRANLQRDRANLQRDHADLWHNRAYWHADRRAFWRDWYT